MKNIPTAEWIDFVKCNVPEVTEVVKMKRGCNRFFRIGKYIIFNHVEVYWIEREGEWALEREDEQRCTEFVIPNLHHYFADVVNPTKEEALLFELEFGFEYPIKVK